MTRARVIFTGSVQGVWFRANCQKKALELELNGWVRNLENGDVECVVEGPRKLIVELIEWNRTSQPYAKVVETTVEWDEREEGFGSFTISR